MSNFLNKFSNDEYNGESIVENEHEQSNNQKINQDQMQLPSNGTIDNKNLDQENNQKPFYQQSKYQYIIGGAIATLLVVLIIFFKFTIKAQDFKNQSFETVKKWSEANGVKLATTQQYSTLADQGAVISQNASPGSFVFKPLGLTLVVSKGANPEEVVQVPDLKKMSGTEVKAWAEKNRLDNVNFEESYSEKHGKDKVLDYSFTEADVNNNNYRRKNFLNIKISKGSFMNSRNLEVLDFSDKTKAEIEKWAEDNKTTIDFSSQPSNTVDKNKVISQSVEKGEKISRAQGMSVVVSKGKGKTVPNFALYSKDEVTSHANGLNINITTKYSKKVKYGKLISQSVGAGSKVYDSDKIELVYSEGKPFIADLDGQNKKQVEEYFFGINKKGAKMKYKFVYEENNDASIEVGTVIDTSIKNDYADFGELIYVYLKY